MTVPVRESRSVILRPEMFGAPINKYFQELLRGKSEWSVGERELIATYVSHANECRFCNGIHRAVAVRALDGGVVEKVFDDLETAPISAGLKATLKLVHKLAVTPSAVTRDDAEAVRAAGVSQSALETAIHICAVFCIINRLANSLGFDIPSPTGMDRSAKFLLRFGYDL
jgi:uncharacterized peroxidase-related enzyme